MIVPLNLLLLLGSLASEVPPRSSPSSIDASARPPPPAALPHTLHRPEGPKRPGAPAGQLHVASSCRSSWPSMLVMLANDSEAAVAEGAWRRRGVGAIWGGAEDELGVRTLVVSNY